jgi:aryl-alcohol dehydrogenase-like predicted oxidoreductase
MKTGSNTQERTRFPLSRLTIGTAQFGLTYGVANQSGVPNFMEICAMLEEAASAGINCLDTAAGYGSSEEILGRALEETGLKNFFFVVTKVGDKIPAGLSLKEAQKSICESVENSLRLLRVESLPLVMLHRDQNSAHLEALISCREKGLIERCGVSLMHPDTARHFLADPALDAIQAPANVIDNRFREIISGAHARGVMTFSRSIYLQGLLLMDDSSTPAHLRQVTPDREFFCRMARELSLSLSALLLLSMLSRSELDSLVVGMETRKQLQENIAILQSPPLPAEILEEIGAFAPTVPHWLVDPVQWPSHASDCDVET